MLSGTKVVRILSVCLALSLLGSVISAEHVAITAQRDGALTVIDERGQAVLQMRYWDWGKGFSRVNRKLSVRSEADAAILKSDSRLADNGAYTLTMNTRAAGSAGLRVESLLEPSAAGHVHLAMAGIKLPASVTGVIVENATGEQRTVPAPFARGSFSAKVSALTWQVGEDQYRIAFDAPTELQSDGEIRIVLASGDLAVGSTHDCAFTFSVPGSLSFLHTPQALRSHPSASLEGWYEFSPPARISDDSEWQMRSWAGEPAGTHGRIVRRGDKLIYNNQPIKLWGLNNSYQYVAPEKALADKRADFYAAMGVNSVRLHKYAQGPGWKGVLNTKSAAVYDPKKLDSMLYYMSALKERGIFTKLSPVFIINIGPGDGDTIPYKNELGKPDKDGWINPRHGAFYLSEELQDLLITQVVTLLQTHNPHTGLTVAEDPAVAYFELYNEDSALFGGVMNAMTASPTLRQRAGAMFATWLQDHYPNEAAWRESWGEQAINNGLLKRRNIPQDESWDEGRIYPIGNPWFFDPANHVDENDFWGPRMLDTIQFLGQLQDQVYARYEQAIRDAGYKGEVIYSNWQAGRMASHFTNLYSDSLGGTIDRHNYFGGGGMRGMFNSNSMLSRAGSEMFSSSMQQVDGLPFMLSEWIHVAPNEWGVEGPAIIGAYGMGLQGWDVSYAFQRDDEGTYSPAIAMRNWDVTVPQFLGIFPAVSRQVRRGDVSVAKGVHYRNVHVPSLAQGTVGFEQLSVQDWDVKSFSSDVFPVASLAATRGVVRFVDEFTPTEPFDITPYRHGQTIVSDTQQLSWTEGETAQDGFIAINTPATQAVVGFAQDKKQLFQDSELTLTTEYAALYLTALENEDNAAIATSKRILISAIARARNEKQVVINDVYLADRGYNRRGPHAVVLEPVTASIRLTRSGTPTVYVLDQGGVKTGATLPIENGIIQIDTGRDQTPYYLIEYP